VTSGAVLTAASRGLTLTINSNELFLTAFTRQHGAHLAVTSDTAKVTPAQLAKTRRLPGVTQAAGPYPETYITPTTGHASGQWPAHSKTSRLSIPHGQVNPGASAPGKPLALVGRAAPSGPLDELALQQGRWATRPGQIDIDPRLVPFRAAIGSTITVTSAPGKPKLTVVGYASSLGRDEAAWVASSQVAALRPAGAPAQQQMLYTFSQADTVSQVSADLATLTAALPAGAVDSWVSWLSSDNLIAASQGVNTPFVVSFAVIGLMLAVMITASVVAAAVVASYRRIGVLKSIGFTPAQVTATYLAQIGLPALAGAIAGTALGVWRVLPLVNGGSSLFNLTVTVPLWIDITVPLGMLALTGVAAAVPALRAGRLRAVQAITAGQAPPPRHGYAVHRLAAQIPLPRPVTAGLAAPLTRPARSLVTLAAITFGADRGGARHRPGHLTRQDQPRWGPVAARRGDLGRPASSTAGVHAQPAAGSGRRVGCPARDGQLRGRGDHPAARAGHPPFLGRQRARRGPSRARHRLPGQRRPARLGHHQRALVRPPRPGSGQHRLPRHRQPDHRPGHPHHRGRQDGHRHDHRHGLQPGHRRRPAHQLADASWRNRPGRQPVHRRAAARRQTPRLRGGAGQDTGARLHRDQHHPGTKRKRRALRRHRHLPHPPAHGLGRGTGRARRAQRRTHGHPRTRPRPRRIQSGRHDPQQVITMVTCWAISPAIAAAIIALPAGMALHDAVMHAIASDQAVLPQLSTLPGSLVRVYTPGGLTLLTLAGLAIAVAGALGPATRAAASRTTTALRTE
jgi:FtsX-like permease family